MTARVHPGETPASFVCQGLVDWLLGGDPQAVQLRGAATVVVVPMLNPDGVFLGNYRLAIPKCGHCHSVYVTDWCEDGRVKVVMSQCHVKVCM